MSVSGLKTFWGMVCRAALRMPDGHLSPAAFSPMPRAAAAATATAISGNVDALAASGFLLPSNEPTIAMSSLWDQQLSPGSIPAALQFVFLVVFLDISPVTFGEGRVLYRLTRRFTNLLTPVCAYNQSCACMRMPSTSDLQVGLCASGHLRMHYVCTCLVGRKRYSGRKCSNSVIYATRVSEHMAGRTII
jgi:hypothetical protein